jgi:hypothetical protein
MLNDNTIVIPFSSRSADTVTNRLAPSMGAGAGPQISPRPSASTLQAIPLAMSICGSSPGGFPDPAIVAKVAISFARRKGVAMNSVPKIFREQLMTLCDVSDPTALMLRDWLEGNRAFVDATSVGEGA